MGPRNTDDVAVAGKRGNSCIVSGSRSGLDGQVSPPPRSIFHNFACNILAKVIKMAGGLAEKECIRKRKQDLKTNVSL